MIEKGFFSTQRVVCGLNPRYPSVRAVCQKSFRRKYGLDSFMRPKLVTNSSPKIGCFRGVLRYMVCGKARQAKGFRLLMFSWFSKGLNPKLKPNPKPKPKGWRLQQRPNRYFYRVNFEVTNLKPFPYLAFPQMISSKMDPKQASFDGELMASLCLLPGHDVPIACEIIFGVHPHTIKVNPPWSSGQPPPDTSWRSLVNCCKIIPLTKASQAPSENLFQRRRRRI
jgi:hypothetical protein